MNYQDFHLSHSGLRAEQGFFGELDVTVVEDTCITEEGHLIPSSGLGNNLECIAAAKKPSLKLIPGDRWT